MANSSSKFKMGRDSLTHLIVKYPQNEQPFKRYSLDGKSRTNPSYGVSRLERIFLQGKSFEWAVLYDNKTNQKICYYHSKTNTKQLDKEEYFRMLGNASLKIYIIYTAEYKRRTGRTKGMSIPIESLDEVAQYWNADVERIMIYQNGQAKQYFMKGQFFKS